MPATWEAMTGGLYIQSLSELQGEFRINLGKHTQQGKILPHSGIHV